MMRSWGILQICLILPMLGIPDAALAQGRAAAVLVEEVDTRAIADTAPVIGQFVASIQADVASRRAGVTDNVLFETGDRVTADAPLVLLDTTLTEIERRIALADLAVANAGIQAAEARLMQSEQALARQKRLQGSTAFSKGLFEDLVQSVQESKGLLAQATAHVGASQARIEQIDYQIENATIRAPFTGILIERMAQPGQFVSVGQAIAKLLDIEGLEIEADIPVELVQGLALGTQVDMKFSDGIVVSGASVRVMLPIETIATRTRPVRFSLDLSKLDPHLLAVGNSVTLYVPVSAPRDIVTVPKDALVQGRGGGWMVFVVADDKAEPRPVTLGQTAGGRMEVIDGLAPGEIVVVRGNERLRPGQTVTATPVGG